MLYFSIVYPRILYGIELYANTYTSYLENLLKLNNKILRILQFKPRMSSTPELYACYGTLPITLLFKYQILLFVRKYVHDFSLLPSVFTDFLKVNALHHSFNTRIKNDFHVTYYSTNYGSRSYSTICCKYWNDLPSHLKSLSSLPIFSSHLKKYLIATEIH